MFKVYNINGVIEVYEIDDSTILRQYRTQEKKKRNKESQNTYDEIKKSNEIWTALEIFGYTQIKEDIEINPEILEKESEKSREYYRKRQRIELRRIIGENFNQYSYFSTLTFKEKEFDIKRANKKVSRYIDDIRITLKRREADSNIKYLFIPELHEDGAIHYHGLINTEMSFKELNSKWCGICENKVIDEVDNIGAYIVSYISKSITNGELEKKSRMVIKSRNLQKPSYEIFDENPYKEMEPHYINEWEVYGGEKIKYYQYNFNKKEKKILT